MIRIAHLSDLHISTQPPHWSAFGDRRLSGALNLAIGKRRNAYRHSRYRGERAVEQIVAESPDAIVFGGDASSLAEREELAGAAEVLAPLLELGVPCFALPGNHDRYTHRAQTQARFEEAFRDWEQVKGDFRQADLGSVSIGLVDTAQANRLLWDSRGRQITLPDNLPKVLFAHYALLLPDGSPDRHWHSLRNGHDIIHRLSESEPVVWCSGHIHHAFEVQRGNLRQFSAGSVGSPAATWQMIEVNEASIQRRGFSAREPALDNDR